MNKRIFPSIVTAVALSAAGCAAPTGAPNDVNTNGVSETAAVGSNAAKAPTQPSAEDLRKVATASTEMRAEDLPNLKNELTHRIVEDAPSQPVIYNAGIGCQLGDCLWIEASWLGNSPDIAIFEADNWAKLGDYYRVGTDLWAQNYPGFVNYTLRLSEPQVIKLYTTGLEVFAVDQTFGAWSAPVQIGGR